MQASIHLQTKTAKADVYLEYKLGGGNEFSIFKHCFSRKSGKHLASRGKWRMRAILLSQRRSYLWPRISQLSAFFHSTLEKLWQNKNNWQTRTRRASDRDGKRNWRKCLTSTREESTSWCKKGGGIKKKNHNKWLTDSWKHLHPQVLIVIVLACMGGLNYDFYFRELTVQLKQSNIIHKFFHALLVIENLR